MDKERAKTSSSNIPYVVVGSLNAVAVLISTLGDVLILTSIKGNNIFPILLTILAGLNNIVVPLFVSIRADGHMTLYYVFITMIPAVQIALYAIVVLIVGCCGYAVGSLAAVQMTGAGAADYNDVDE